MCSPALALTGLMAGGTALKTVGTIQEGRSAAAVAAANAQASQEQSIDALVRGSIEEARYRREIAQLIGAQRAAIGANNVAAGSGTALDILSDSAYWGEKDAQQIRKNAGRESQAYRAQADEFLRQKRSAKRMTPIAATSTLLTGGAQAYGMWRTGR